MLAVARRRVVGLPVAAGDLRSLAVRTGSVAGIVAFYVLQHLERSALRPVLEELRRVLTPGGLLLIAAHAGDGEFMPAPEIRATRYTAAESRRHARTRRSSSRRCTIARRSGTSTKVTGSTSSPGRSEPGVHAARDSTPVSPGRSAPKRPAPVPWVSVELPALPEGDRGSVVEVDRRVDLACTERLRS